MLLLLSSPAFAQFTPLHASSLGGTVTLDREWISLEDALHEVARQANVNVVFGADVVEREPDRPVHLRNVTAAEAVLHLLANTHLEALFTDKGSIVIRPRESRPQGQTVRGVVLDRATRVPLTGANVVVVGSEPLIGTTADMDGAFVLEHVPLGRQDVLASYIGYRSIVIPEVLVTSGKEVVLEILLEEEVLSGAEILVTADLRKDQPINEMSLVSARSFSVEETRRFAGGLDDPARMASSFAGVAAGAGIQENGIIVRGNAPKGVLWRLEGVEIPNPNHFAGLVVMGAGGVTLFSSQLLDNSDFLTGAFSPEYGNALAGVFDMNFRSGNPSTREHTVQVGLIGIDLASEGPFSRSHSSTYLVNYRYSTIGLLLPLLPTEDVASFQDLSFKLTFPTRAAGRFDVWGIGGIDTQSMEASQDSTEWEYEIWDRIDSDLDLAVGAAGASHRLIVGERSLLHSTAAVTVNRMRVDQQRIDDSLVLRDNLSIDNTTGRVIVGTSLSHKFSPRHVIRTGVTLQQIFYDFDLQTAPFDRPPLVSVAAGSGS
ncbi:MAG: carboxypeptidase regulatory-like domain-containing protein, partial [Rhodothermales bacterium]